MAYNIYQHRSRGEMLRQGDILDSNQLRDIFRGHQDYYAEQEHFRYFMVLTQTCDLARNGIEYICLAAARKLSDAIKYREFESRDARQSKGSSFIRDLYLHNYNKRGYFYLPKNNNFGIEDDFVVDLRVMLSLHKQHYPGLLDARIIGLTDLYAAQLGHIAGHMFNRVATPDWEEIREEADAPSAEKQGQNLLDNFWKEYQQTLNELLCKENSCYAAGCAAKPEAFRWFPTSELGQSGLRSFQHHVLCKVHAKQWDGERTLT